MTLTEARGVAASGKPVTKAEFQTVYAVLNEHAFKVTLWMFGLLAATLIAGGLLFHAGRLEWWVVVVFVVLNLPTVTKAIRANGELRIWSVTANLIW